MKYTAEYLPKHFDKYFIGLCVFPFNEKPGAADHSSVEWDVLASM